MRLIRFLLRAFLLIAGALLGLGLLLVAVIAFTGVLLVSVLTGRKPNLQFRMQRNPWAQRGTPPVGDVVDIEAREVKDAAPLPLQPPPR
ncbi:MAG: hypothetical protein EOP39_19205 [Rubrivivax sp.]|nr:MAG: hypothetical protein EOP39_19205 [Rubrivivax sp.]